MGKDIVRPSHHRLEIVVLRRGIIHANQISIDPKHRWIICREMKVRRFLLGHQFEKCEPWVVTHEEAKLMPAATISGSAIRSAPATGTI